MAPHDQAARLCRERDGRLLRAMVVMLFVSACLVGAVLGIVGVKVSQVRLSYRLDQLRVLQTDLEEVTRQLRVELVTLKALSRVESKARDELGMFPPSRDQVRLAREYVPGITGTASLRTAREDRLPPGGPPTP